MKVQRLGRSALVLEKREREGGSRAERARDRLGQSVSDLHGFLELYTQPEKVGDDFLQEETKIMLEVRLVLTRTREVPRCL